MGTEPPDQTGGDLLGPNEESLMSTLKSPTSLRKAASISNLIRLMLRQFGAMRDQSAADFKASVALWVSPLMEKPLPAIAAARDRWLATQSKTPTIAEFLALVGTLEAKPEGRHGSPPENLSPEVAGVKPSAMTGSQFWSWQARMHASHQMRGLEGNPGCDRDGRYRDDNLIEQAKAEAQMPYPDDHRMHKRGFSCPAALYASMRKGAERKYPVGGIRESFMDLPPSQLTALESDQAMIELGLRTREETDALDNAEGTRPGWRHSGRRRDQMNAVEYKLACEDMARTVQRSNARGVKIDVPPGFTPTPEADLPPRHDGPVP